ncbi:hypothetical protein D5086_013828 [Populus alba]|uniref:Uncharacterized protein n=1 Tax=Populus alba TaxID=43335 RepID=A0ACC4C787_POPAL
MGLSGVKPNDFTFSTNLKACGLLNGLDIGRQIHDICVKTGFDMVNVVGNSIIDMYSKCGRINEAACMFEVMPVRNLISWNAMIAGYTVAGFCEKALVLFQKMQEVGGFLDEFTFTSTLKACSDLGAIKEGNQIHAFLITGGFLYSVSTAVAGALIDLYVKCGKLFMARRVFSHIEEKHVISWTALILGYWKECESIRELVKSKKLKKEAGRSWVEIDKEVHFFYGGDDTHPLTEKIHEILKEMERRMKEELGYVYGVKYALHDVEEESKMENLRVHSEKLAIGLALVCGGSEEGRKVIRVFKNLRVCGDCHEFIKEITGDFVLQSSYPPEISYHFGLGNPT